MKEQIVSLQQLQEVSEAYLGIMDPNGDEIFSLAHEIAKEKGIKNPQLMLFMKYGTESSSFVHVSQSGSIIGFPYTNPPLEVFHAVARFEWDQIFADKDHLLMQVPEVYLVDGDKYTQ